MTKKRWTLYERTIDAQQKLILIDSIEHRISRIEMVRRRLRKGQLLLPCSICGEVAVIGKEYCVEHLYA